MLTRIGDVEIWRILESVDPFFPRDFFPATGDEDLAFFEAHAPRQLCPRTGRMLFPIQGFPVKTPRHAILVGACIGNDKTREFYDLWHRRSSGRFMAGSMAAGQAESMGPDRRLGDRVAPIPISGHVAVQARDGGRKATIAGDALHRAIVRAIVGMSSG